MPIILKSDEYIRPEVLRYLEAQRQRNPQYRVLDIGGAGNPWCDEFVDAYVDIQPVNTAKRVILGDINEPEVWREILATPWDFCICTHVLEDIRNPAFVLANLQRAARGGFIATPNKHTEFTSIESPFYVGYCHHRWIFTIRADNQLYLLAKWPVTSLFATACQAVYGLANHTIFHPPHFAGWSLPWLQPGKVHVQAPRYELGFVWEGEFPFQFINQDFCGQNALELVALYQRELQAGL